MYKVLLVDDEPIVLSGIKFLIDWEKLDCRIEGTARNGQQAIELIENLRPHIVVCDINMPLSSGIDVLKSMYEKPYAPAFIMLTNHQEFDMARNSLRYKAVDYLLKTQLDSESLEHAVLGAIAECDKKAKIANLNVIDEAAGRNNAKLLQANLQKLWKLNGVDRSTSAFSVLESNGFLKNYFMLEVRLDYSALPENFNEKDLQRIYECEREFIKALFSKGYLDYAIFSPDDRFQRFVIFVWNAAPETCRERVETFFARLCLSSESITPTALHLLMGSFYSDAVSLGECLKEQSRLQEAYFRTAKTWFAGDGLPEQVYTALDLQKEITRLIFEIRSKNIAQTKVCINNFRVGLETVFCPQQDVIMTCIKLYTAVAAVLTTMQENSENDDYFQDAGRQVSQLKGFIRFTQIEAWVETLQTHILKHLDRITSAKSEVMEKAKRYISERLEQKIMLQDVAQYVSISPSYFSTLFKKEFGQNLFDYINEAKIERACGMIRDGKLRIYEISYQLGFEKPYYFTKVFKRYKGMTPKEYQCKIRGKAEADD